MCFTLFVWMQIVNFINCRKILDEWNQFGSNTTYKKHLIKITIFCLFILYFIYLLIGMFTNPMFIGIVVGIAVL